ncbi:hypothetical protein RIF29_20705 [Crotalaria pallida]|uniref:Cobalamin-independent methionine synthase MetE N-terminal domain-containing protein n=1 Tax=Crotalaria pallida TaxID=3830 RepID=A0AAN9FA71_CROPI
MNVHFIFPELGPDVNFTYSSYKAVEEYEEAKALGVDTVPVLIGPVSYLLLSKPAKGVEKSFSLLPKTILASLLMSILHKKIYSQQQNCSRPTSMKKCLEDRKMPKKRNGDEAEDTAEIDGSEWVKTDSECKYCSRDLNLPQFLLPLVLLVQANKISEEEYVKAITEEIRKVVELQEELDISELDQTPNEGNAYWPCHHPQLVLCYLCLV